MRIAKGSVAGTGRVMMALLAAGCAEDDAPAATDDPNAPVTVTFLRHDNPNYVAADTAFFNEYRAAHPNVTIQDPTVDFRTLAASLVSELANDQFSYDFVLIPPSRMCSFAENLADVPEDIVTLAQAQNTFFAAPLENATCDGKLKGLPVEYNLEYGGVVVNLDKFQQKFPDRQPGWERWEDFLRDAAALSEYDEAGNPMANGLDIDPVWSPPTWHILFAQILQRGGDFWNPGRQRMNLTTPEAIASLTSMVSWVNQDRIMFPALIPDKNTGVTSRLAYGATGFGWSDPLKPLSVMGYLGTWGVPSVTGQIPEGQSWRFDFHALPPMVGTEHRFVTDGGWAFAVPRTSRHQRVAWDIIRSLALSPEAMRRWSAITGALPALKVNGTESAAQGNPVLARVQPLLEHGRWRGFIPIEALEVVNSALLTNFFATVRGEKTVVEALEIMQTTINDALAQYRTP